jgi:hypothetical protein
VHAPYHIKRDPVAPERFAHSLQEVQDPPPFNFDEDVPSAPVQPARKINPGYLGVDPRDVEEPPSDWVDVSGASLLCGARALRGCIGVNSHYRPSLELLTNLLSSSVKHRSDAFNFLNYYAFEQIREVAIFYFGISISLFDGSGDLLYGNPTRIHPLHYTGAGLMRLVNRHYNFWGIPQPSMNSSNAYITSRFQNRASELVTIFNETGYTLSEPGIIFDYYSIQTQEERNGFFTRLPPLFDPSESDEDDPDFDESLIFAFFETTLLSLPNFSNLFENFEIAGPYCRALVLNVHLKVLQTSIPGCKSISPLQRFRCMRFWLLNLDVSLNDIDEFTNILSE